MPLNRQNVIVLAVTAISVFVVIAALLVRFLPQPRKDSDFLVIGAVSTLAALGVVFGAILYRGGAEDGGSVKGAFFKKRK